jgi:hypothetical protein
LWFGNEAAPREENSTYGTARVLRALAELAPLQSKALPLLIFAVEALRAARSIAAAGR